MTFLAAMRRARKTGCLFHRRPEFKECASCAAKPGAPVLCPPCLRRRSGEDLPKNRFRSWHCWGLLFDGRLEEYYWDGGLGPYGGRKPGAWHAHDGIFLKVEDYMADDWVCRPLKEWFLDEVNANAWNPLKVKQRWER